MKQVYNVYGVLILLYCIRFGKKHLAVNQYYTPHLANLIVQCFFFTAVLAAGAPEHAPFMADESMLAIPGLSPLQYTPPFYNRYAEQIKACVDRLNKEGKRNV